MTTIEYVHTHIFPAVFALLPPQMNSREARAEMLAIGLQESRFKHRVQVGGPAHGFWQFEKGGGVRGVLSHASSQSLVESVLDAMSYDRGLDTSYDAIVHNDVLAGVFARLLLRTSPLPLPKEGDAHGGWQMYLSCWRPGKPHPGTWDGFYARAWEIVEA